MSSRRWTLKTARLTARGKTSNVDYSRSSLDLELKSAAAQATKARVRVNTFAKFAARRRAEWQQTRRTVASRLASLREALARCDAEIAAIDRAPESHTAPAYLVTLGREDWICERRLIEREMRNATDQESE